MKETEKQHSSSKIVMGYNHMKCMNGADISFNIRIFENPYTPGQVHKKFCMFFFVLFCFVLLYSAF